MLLNTHKLHKRHVEQRVFEKLTVQSDPEKTAEDIAVEIVRDIPNSTFRPPPETSNGSSGMVKRFQLFVDYEELEESGSTQAWCCHGVTLSR